jgi:hypothetical protein
VIQPDRLLFLDEVGSNTLQTKDGKNVGSQKLSCKASQQPQTQAATKFSPFTVLGFNVATGIPLSDESFHIYCNIQRGQLACTMV